MSSMMEIINGAKHKNVTFAIAGGEKPKMYFQEMTFNDKQLDSLLTEEKNRILRPEI
jgi:hypothetical protein